MTVAARAASATTPRAIASFRRPVMAAIPAPTPATMRIRGASETSKAGVKVSIGAE